MDAVDLDLDLDLDPIAALGVPFCLSGSFATREKLVEARAAGAHSVQLGTVCAFSDESGLRADLKRSTIEMFGNIDEQEDGLPFSRPTIKQHLAAIKMLFDYLVTGQIVPFNPASAVRGPKYSTKRGKTPVLTAAEAKELIESIDTSTVIGLRDQALIGLMLYSFSRISAVVGMRVGDVFVQGRRTWIRLAEKGGKCHEVPVHHKADEYLHAYPKFLKRLFASGCF